MRGQDRCASDFLGSQGNSARETPGDSGNVEDPLICNGTAVSPHGIGPALAGGPVHVTARKDMHVQVEHALVGSRTVVDHDPKTVLGEALLVSDLPGRPEEVAEQFLVVLPGIRETPDPGLGDDQDVDRGLGRDVPESQAVVVLVDPIRGDLPAEDLGKDVVVVVGRGHGASSAAAS